MSDHHRLHLSAHHRGSGPLVKLADLWAAVAGSPLVLALVTAWLAVWIAAPLFVRGWFDPAPYPLLLALASIPQLPIGIAILVVSVRNERVSDARAQADHETIVAMREQLDRIEGHRGGKG